MPSRATSRRSLDRPGVKGLSEAAEGTRTLDLLHGKQTLGTAKDEGNACKFGNRGGSTPRADPGKSGPIRANTEPQRGRGSNRLGTASRRLCTRRVDNRVGPAQSGVGDRER